jgi:hypothetical protein
LKDLDEKKLPSFQQGLAVCETMPEVAYISITSTVTGKKGEIEEIYSIYKTLNAGANWEPVFLSSTPSGYITKNFEGSWMEQSYDPGWGGSPINLGVAPGNPDICYAGDNGRGYKTVDGGKTWKQVYSQNRPDSSYSNTGLNVTTCYGINFDPFDKDHFFICYTDIGLFHTFNGGKSWFQSVKGLPREWVNTCYSVEFDRRSREKSGPRGPMRMTFPVRRCLGVGDSPILKEELLFQMMMAAPGIKVLPACRTILSVPVFF